jgi:hypothetical protein
MRVSPQQTERLHRLPFAGPLAARCPKRQCRIWRLRIDRGRQNLLRRKPQPSYFDPEEDLGAIAIFCVFFNPFQEVTATSMRLTKYQAQINSPQANVRVSVVRVFWTGISLN